MVVEERMWRQWSERARAAFNPQQWWEQTQSLEQQHGRMRSMWVYQETEKGCWTVGYYDPSGKWHVDSDHGNKELAAARVNYLNGGTGKGK